MDRDEITLDTPVTTVIRQHPLPSQVVRYEAWLKEIIPVARTFAGHQGVNIIRPQDAADPYTIVVHFHTIGTLRRWLDSQARKRLLDEIKPCLRAEEDIDIQTGIEFWFTPASAARHAKPYKQFLITLSVIFPLTVVVPWLLRPLYGWFPGLALPGISHFLVAAIIVALMVYVIMPRYTRAVAPWLFR